MAKELENKKTIRKKAIQHMLRILFQRIIGIGLFFAAAGTFKDIRGMTNISLYLIISIVGSALMLSSHQNTLSEREKKRKDTKRWDKFLMPILVILMFHVIYFIAGLGIRLHWNKLPMECFYVGSILYLLASVFTTWPILANKYFEGTSRIQKDREQTVISSGPYKIVRHPGYLGAILWAIASYLMFGTLPVGIICFFIIAILCIRTHLEDKMLREELSGYLEYSQTTKHRLIPFVW